MPIRLEDYDISATTGFLPEQAPLEVLSNNYYAPWERIARNLQALIMTRRLRGVIDDLPVLSTTHLTSYAEWRRAYSILAFMTHGYIWSGDQPCERVPPSISIPFIATCNRLELPPVATYAAVVLWNFKPLFEDEHFDNLDNLLTLTTYTGAVDESWFYLVSVAIEARGAPTIQLMLDAIEAAQRNDSDFVVRSLQSFAERLDELASLLTRMYENCNPDFFYHKIRPFLAGSKNMAEAGLPNGVLFDTGDPDDVFVQYSGGSNAQSSIIQFFDIVLGIEHRPTTSSAGIPSTNFIKDMRTHMPGPHARFLSAVECQANIRSYVDEHCYNRALVTAYDACLAMLHAFRDKHIQMVSRYIIIKSRQSRRPSTSIAPSLPSSREKLNLATATTDSVASMKPKGTGGTSLIPFLKQARDETGDPAVAAWARKLLGPVVGGSGRIRGSGPHRMAGKVTANGETEILGLAGVWNDDDEALGGICHW